ncbi:MAG TPA: NADH:flavin oxidoreductase/NADH oxidase [Pseudolysinimonas sp.]|nr:NADH:flavin oxidoreductase/NADH oxidase [Pseudolysinimonas sp.]
MTESALFTPLTIRGVTFRNRLWVSPMCQYSCDELDGVPTDWHLVNLGQTAFGTGLVFAESTAVSPEGRITAEDTGIWNDEQVAAWSRITRFIHSQGARAGIQIGHAGRKASDYRLFDPRCGTTKPESEGGWKTVAPSAIDYPGFDVPTELDTAGIEQIIDDFAAAGRRSVEAGFDVIEIHAAHGYLIHEFLSPLSNHRTDEWGGSLENRARLLIRIVAAVRTAVGEDPAVFVRFSGTDWTEGGWDMDQTVQAAVWAQEAGADFFDMSSGGLLAGIFISLEPGYQVPLAARIKEELGHLAGAVGLITDPVQANDIVASGDADAVILAREFIRNPHFALRAANELGVDLDYWPRQYLGVKNPGVRQP